MPTLARFTQPCPAYLAVKVALYTTAVLGNARTLLSLRKLKPNNKEKNNAIYGTEFPLITNTNLVIFQQNCQNGLEKDQERNLEILNPQRMKNLLILKLLLKKKKNLKKRKKKKRKKRKKKRRKRKKRKRRKKKKRKRNNPSRNNPLKKNNPSSEEHPTLKYNSSLKNNPLWKKNHL